MDPRRSRKRGIRVISKTLCRQLFREIDRCRTDEGKIDTRDWTNIWENSGFKGAGFSMKQMRQKVYKMKTRKNVATLQEYEDFVCTDKPHPKLGSLVRQPRAPETSRQKAMIAVGNNQTIAVPMSIIEAEKSILENLRKVSNVVTGPVLYSVDLWLYFRAQDAVSYNRFRKLAMKLEQNRIFSLIQRTIPPITEEAATSIAVSMVTLRTQFGDVFDPSNQTETLTSTLEIGVNAVQSSSGSPCYNPSLPCRRLTDCQWIKILQADSNVGLLAKNGPQDWLQLVNRLGISTTRSGRNIMEDFYSYVLPRIQESTFGMLGPEVLIELEATHRYTMTTIYHSVQDWNVDSIRCAVENLLKFKILASKKENPCVFWCNLFWQNLYSKNCVYFCTDDVDFEAFKRALFGIHLPNTTNVSNS